MFFGNCKNFQVRFFSICTQDYELFLERMCIAVVPWHRTFSFNLFNLMGATTEKSANSFKKSVYGPGSVYTVARARDGRYLFCVSDSVTLSRSILNELNLYLLLLDK